MSAINLQPFCARKSQIRPKMNQPWNIGEFTYATDGRIMVRVPACPEFASNPPMTDEKTIAEIWGVWSPTQAFQALTGLIIPTTKTQKCEECNGLGRFCDCPDCGGNGDKYCRTCDHVSACNRCRGQGKVAEIAGVALKTCEDCDGVGTYKVGSPTRVGNKNINSLYLELIAGLPGIEIAPEATGELEPLHFKFESGAGLIMPMRV